MYAARLIESIYGVIASTQVGGHTSCVEAKREACAMIYPGEIRLERANVSRFYSEFVRPQLPDDVAMPNDGEDTPFRSPFADDLVDLISANTQHCILLSL